MIFTSSAFLPFILCCLMTKKASRKSTGGASFYCFQAAETLYSGGKSVKRRIKREEKELSSFYFFLDKNALRVCNAK